MSINTNNILNYIKVTTTVQQPSKTTSNNSNISTNTNNILNYIKVTSTVQQPSIPVCQWQMFEVQFAHSRLSVWQLLDKAAKIVFFQCQQRLYMGYSNLILWIVVGNYTGDYNTEIFGYFSAKMTIISGETIDESNMKIFV